MEQALGEAMCSDGESRSTGGVQECGLTRCTVPEIPSVERSLANSKFDVFSETLNFQ